MNKTDETLSIQNESKLFQTNLFGVRPLIAKNSGPCGQAQKYGKLDVEVIAYCWSNTLFSNATHKPIVTAKRPYDNVLYQLFSAFNSLSSFILFNISTKALLKYTRVSNAVRFCSFVRQCWTHSLFLLRRKYETNAKRGDSVFSWNFASKRRSVQVNRHIRCFLLEYSKGTGAQAHPLLRINRTGGDHWCTKGTRKAFTVETI